MAALVTFVHGSLTLLLLFVSDVCCTTTLPPKFVLNLAKPALQRWNGSVTTVLKTHPWEYSFGPMFEAHNKTLFSKLTSEQFEGLGLSIKRNFPDQSLELQGISNEFFHHGHYVSFEYLAAWVYFHELAHVSSLITTANQAKWFKSCSAVLTQDPKDNSIWHGRNMDASPFNVRNVTLQISVVNNIANNMEEIEILFHAADWYWITTGFMTAMKPNLIGLQENWRFIDVNLNDVFTKASKGVLPQVFLFRKTLTEATSMSSYNSIINTLQTIELAAPEYIIASGGNNNGQVIVRELNYTSKVVHIGDQGSFNYLMWTNYDSCLGEPKTDVRCKPGLELLEEMGETLSGSSMGVYAVTSAYPIHNPSTAYTVVMNVKHNVFQTFVRDPLKLVLNYSVSGKDYL